MKIKHKIIDSNYFELEIETFIKDNKISKANVINITQGNGFTTLWYWTN